MRNDQNINDDVEERMMVLGKRRGRRVVMVTTERSQSMWGVKNEDICLLIGGSDCCKPCVRRNVSNDGHDDDEANDDGAEV